MNETYYIMRSRLDSKKFTVIILYPFGTNYDIIHFGAKGYSDYTIHNNPIKKINYIARHKPNEDWSNPKTAGFWSRWILWNKKTLAKSVEDVKKRFGLNVILDDTKVF